MPTERHPVRPKESKERGTDFNEYGRRHAVMDTGYLNAEDPSDGWVRLTKRNRASARCQRPGEILHGGKVIRELFPQVLTSRGHSDSIPPHDPGNPTWKIETG